ncbi:SusC/RagA family TonB-linked outer membrane protein [Chitinophaga sp. S165]|uniref:SusC/RagA family TonB-linked outer membrane protein n=1 Tax=Chitinophaga sp. S165 TaxID=2135462 RepID=UPI000D709CF6|nr:SusC/RagA family TonB-linked outer membrane protein [Chitinophaga sp. S165]PWV44521.1 TonB-linked SusC/RagA family outer membrane protein [Chitinophaga sp. S165]
MTIFTLTCGRLIRGIVVSLACSCAVGTVCGQPRIRDTLITISKDSMTLKKVIVVLEKKGYRIVNNDHVNPSIILPVKCRDLPLNRFLAMLFKDRPVECLVRGTHISLRRKPVVADLTVIRRTVLPHEDVVAAPPLRIYNGKPYVVKAPLSFTDTSSRQAQRLFRIRDLAMNASSNILDDLMSKETGVVMQRSSGRPAASINVEIRGPTSLARSSQPLYIIDEVPVWPYLKGGEGTMSPSSSTLSYFSPADIDTIVVLKNAAATALYGARGANGVIKIYTKRARYNGRRVITADVAYGFGHVPRKETLLHTSDYLQMRREAWMHDGLQPSRGKAPDLLVWDTTRYTDWQKVLIGNTAWYRDASITITEGKPVRQYRISFNYRENSSVFMQDEEQYGDRKFGIHSDLNIRMLNNKLSFSFAGTANINSTRLPGADYTAGITLPPNGPALFTDGKVNYAFSNSVVSMPEFYNLISNVLVSTNASYQLHPLLKFVVLAGYHRMGARSTSISPIAKRGEEGQANLTAASIENRFHSQTFVIEPSAQLKLQADSHRVELTLGATYNSIYAVNKTIDAEGYKRDADILNYGAAAVFRTSRTRNDYRYAGAYGDLHYSWKDKYSVQLTLRIDGSSRFGKDEQMNAFGGGALGWEFGKEAFIRHALPRLSYGRIQIGWSTTGNDQIEDYQYEGSYQRWGSYQSVTGLVTARQQNSALTGGITYKKDISVDVGFFDNRLQAQAAYYYNRSQHQLVEYPLPEMAGGGSLQQNMPVSIQNKGVELTLNGTLLRNKYWGLRMHFNISKGTNMLLSFPGMLSSVSGQTQLKRPLRELFYYDFNGVDPKSGEYTYRNKEGSIVTAGALTENDRTMAINISPEFYGGFGITGTFRRLELSCSGQYMKRAAENPIIDKGRMPGTMWNQHVYVMDRWKQTGDNTPVQRATQASSSEQDYRKYVNSTAIFTDVWYLRVNNVTVAWQFKKCRLYYNVVNLITFTNYQSLDPETLSRTVLPSLRVFKAGVQYQF